MGYTTLGKALYWLEAPSGKTVRDNRCELVDLLNRIRQHFYLLYQEIPLFMDGEECVEVQEFPLDCSCRETYTGITLPAVYETVEAIWINDVPVKMYDKWREYRDGIKCGAKLSAHDMDSFYPTERDLWPCGKCSVVKLMATDDGDVGKTAVLRYKDGNGQDVEDNIVLDTSYVSTSRPVLYIEPRGGVVLPGNLCGPVLIADGTGRVLSRYAPWETVPSYRRLRLDDVCVGDQVYIKASRRFHELYFDDDVVETDNRLAFEEAAKYFRYNDSPSGDLGYEQKAASHSSNAKFYLLGEKSRHRGKATISNVNLSQGRKNQGQLLSRRRSIRSRAGRTWR